MFICVMAQPSSAPVVPAADANAPASRQIHPQTSSAGLAEAARSAFHRSRLLSRPTELIAELTRQRLMAFLAPLAEPDQMLLQAFHRIAQGPGSASLLDGSARDRRWWNARTRDSHELDQCGAEPGRARSAAIPSPRAPRENHCHHADAGIPNPGPRAAKMGCLRRDTLEVEMATDY